MPLATDRLASPGAFRLTLAFAVFLHHTTSFNIGSTAVLVFFVLSGYWVATMWNRTYANTSAAYFTYLTSRFWRVAPVFALCSGISWALLHARGGAPAVVGDLGHQIFSNVLILGYSSLNFQANIPAWSLDMEVQFYLIAPLVIALISRNVYALVLALGVTLVSQRFGGATTVAPFILFFGVGVAAACGAFTPSKRVAYLSLVATLSTLFICALILAKNVALDETPNTPILAFGNATNVLIAMMMTPWALYTTRQKTGSSDRMLGDFSYIFYLLHWSVIGAIGTGEGSYLNRLFLCGAALVIIFAASWVIWRFFDRPINQWRAAWVETRRLPATAFAATA